VIKPVHYFHAPIARTHNAWLFSVLISFFGHLALLATILAMDSNHSAPIPAQILNVEITTDFTSAEQGTTATKRIKPVKISPSRADMLSRRITQKNFPIKTTEKSIFAPIPNPKPNLFRPEKIKNLKKIGLLNSSTETTIKANKTKPLSPQQEAKSPNVMPTTPGSTGNSYLVAVKQGPSAVSVVPPKLDTLAENLLPQYPRRARHLGLEGRLVLRVTVSPLGRPSILKVLESSGHALLDVAAMKAIKGWHFQPARRGKSPIKASIDLPVVFRLQGNR
jgi:TonB family protein